MLLPKFNMHPCLSLTVMQMLMSSFCRLQFHERMLSALLFSKLISSICTTLLDSELSLDHYLCFTDSKPALSKESTIMWKQFVEYQVTTICGLVKPQCWRHCLGIKILLYGCISSSRNTTLAGSTASPIISCHTIFAILDNRCHLCWTYICDIIWRTLGF